MVALTVAIAAFFSIAPAQACHLPPTLHVSVGSQFDDTTLREDFSLQEIRAMAGKQGAEDRQVLGFYRGEFGYTIDIGYVEGRGCPAEAGATVTLRLTHRVIELGKQVASNTCLLPVALRHYRNIAKADEQVVQRYRAVTETLLSDATPRLRQIDDVHMNTDLRARISFVVEQAIKTLQGNRRRATQAVNNPDELRQLASACAV